MEVKILNKVLPPKLINFDYRKCTNEPNNNFINSDFIEIDGNITKFISESADLLLENGFEINRNIFHVDFHKYYINNEKYETDLTWHSYVHDKCLVSCLKRDKERRCPCCNQHVELNFNCCEKLLCFNIKKYVKYKSFLNK